MHRKYVYGNFKPSKFQHHFNKAKLLYWIKHHTRVSNKNNYSMDTHWDQSPPWRGMTRAAGPRGPWRGWRADRGQAASHRRHPSWPSSLSWSRRSPPPPHLLSGLSEKEGCHWRPWLSPGRVVRQCGKKCLIARLGDNLMNMRSSCLEDFTR